MNEILEPRNSWHLWRLKNTALLQMSPLMLAECHSLHKNSLKNDRRIMTMVLKMKGNTNVKLYYIRFKCMALTFLLLLHEMISKTEYILYRSLSHLWQSDKKQKIIAEIRILRGKNKGVYNEKKLLRLITDEAFLKPWR